MFGRPRDAVPDETAWQARIADGHGFGRLGVNGLPGPPPYGRVLPGIRGRRLEATEVMATFKYDDHQPVGHRPAVADSLIRRGKGLDASTAGRQHRHPDRMGPWKA